MKVWLREYRILAHSTYYLSYVTSYMSAVFTDSQKRLTLGCMILRHGFIIPRSAISQNLGSILLTIITHLGPYVA